MQTLYRIILSSTIDGTEALSPMGWTGDIRAAMWFTAGEEAEAVLAVERVKAEHETLAADMRTGEPFNGRYNVCLDIPSLPVYSLAEYKEQEEEADRLDELCREQARAMGYDL